MGLIDTLIADIRATYTEWTATSSRAHEDEKQALIDAAKAAAIHEFISSLPLGYDTLIGARGIKLSGGERQRLSIARSLLKGSRILLLDEATSSLDNISEQDVKQAIIHLPNKPTRVVIPHRLSTIIDADLIVVMDQGAIVEFGSHKQLLKNNGLYTKLYLMDQEISVV